MAETRRAPVLVLFFVSGALALGYQVLWSRYLLDFIGVSAYSYATVLASFMSGLALGGAILGRWADRTRFPLRLFAGLELAIGGYALVYPDLTRLAASLHERLVAAGPASGGGALWTKALVAGILLLPPTFLMGGTFPAMVRHVAESAEAVGRRSALLYAVNAAGSVAGALAMAFLCLPALGLRGSLFLLGSANAAAALAAGWLARRTPAAANDRPESAAEPDRRRSPLVLVLCAGVVSFAAEIAWTRYLSVVLGSSTYSFAIIVAAFIAGIAVGSAWLSRRAAAIGAPLTFFGVTQMLAGAAILLPLPLYPYAPWLFRQYAALLAPRPSAFVLYEAGKLVLCFTVLVVPAALLGMSLPLVIKERARRLASAGREAGRAYAWNTWGNVAGALLAGHFLLPRMGMEGVLRACALVSGLIGLAAIWLDLPEAADARRKRRVVASTAVLAGLLGLHFGVPRWNPGWFTLEPFRKRAAFSFREAEETVRRHETVLFHDDPAANVLVYRRPATGGEEYCLLVNAKADASSTFDMPTQRLLAHVPLLLAPRARQVFVLGLATGVTAGAVLAHPVEHLDVAEIVQAMPAATRFFAPWNGDPLGDPRSRLIVDDARQYLAHTPRIYDVIVSEPSNPWTAGTGTLFSTDFYARAQRALAPDGVYMQWVQSYEMGDETFAALVRSFRKAFPFVYGFQGNYMDLLLVGSRRPLRPDWTAVQARFARPTVQRQLAAVGIGDVATLLALQRLSPSSVDVIAALTALENNDDNRLLEYRAPRDLFLGAGTTLLEAYDERLWGGGALLWHDFVRRHPGQVDPAGTIRTLSDGRLTVESVRQAFQVAAYHLDPSVLGTRDRPATLLFPPAFWIQPPPSENALADTLGRLIQSRQESLTETLITWYSSAILLQSSLSKDAAARWRRRVDEWSHRAGRWPPLRALRTDLLLADAQAEAAAREIETWTNEPLPPRLEWAAVRACAIDPARLCRATLAAYRRRGPSDVLRRLEELPRPPTQ